MAGYSTYGIMNSKELSPEQKIELLKEQQRNNNNVSMLRTAQDTNWDTMLGYGLGKMARSMYDNYQSRNTFKEQEILRRKEAGEKLPEGWQNWTAQQWKDYNAQQNAMQPTGETTRSVSFNPKTGTIGMEKTENFSGGLLGNMPGLTSSAEPFQNQRLAQNLFGNSPTERFMNEQMGKTLMGNIDGKALSNISANNLFGELPANAVDAAMLTRGGAGAEGIMSNIAENVGEAANIAGKAGEVAEKAGGVGVGDVLGYLGMADKLSKGDTEGALKDGASTYLSTLGPWGMAASLALKLLG